MRAIAASVGLAGLGAVVTCAEPIKRVVIDDEWNALFTRTDGWTGGDVAGSIDLLDGRILWVFGDSWFGKVRDGKHLPGSTMVNNSIAIHSSGNRGERPSAKELSFVAGPTVESKPTAWVVPKGEEKTWYWTNGGGVIAPAGPSNDRKLIVFLFHLTKKKDAKEVWSFQSAGGAMAVVDNVEDPVGQWKPRTIEIPHAVSSGDDTQKPTSWGVSVILSEDETMFYLYGVRDTAPLNKQLLLARAPVAEVEDMAAWQFFAGGGRWSKMAIEAVSIADGMVSELSVSRLKTGGGERYVLIQSEPVFGTRIFARTAERPEGPWSAPHYTRKIELKTPDLSHRRNSLSSPR